VVRVFQFLIRPRSSTHSPPTRASSTSSTPSDGFAREINYPYKSPIYGVCMRTLRHTAKASWVRLSAFLERGGKRGNSFGSKRERFASK
jgi:hypothetical protein